MAPKCLIQISAEVSGQRHRCRSVRTLRHGSVMEVYYLVPKCPGAEVFRERLGQMIARRYTLSTALPRAVTRGQRQINRSYTEINYNYLSDLIFNHTIWPQYRKSLFLCQIHIKDNLFHFLTFNFNSVYRFETRAAVVSHRSQLDTSQINSTQLESINLHTGTQQFNCLEYAHAQTVR